MLFSLALLSPLPTLLCVFGCVLTHTWCENPLCAREINPLSLENISNISTCCHLCLTLCLGISAQAPFYAEIQIVYLGKIYLS